MRDLIPTIVMPLGRTYLCMTCEVLHLTARCPRCGGQEVYPVASWLRQIPR